MSAHNSTRIFTASWVNALQALDKKQQGHKQPGRLPPCTVTRKLQMCLSTEGSARTDKGHTRNFPCGADAFLIRQLYALRTPQHCQRPTKCRSVPSVQWPACRHPAAPAAAVGGLPLATQAVPHSADVHACHSMVRHVARIASFCPANNLHTDSYAPQDTFAVQGKARLSNTSAALDIVGRQVGALAAVATIKIECLCMAGCKGTIERHQQHGRNTGTSCLKNTVPYPRSFSRVTCALEAASQGQPSTMLGRGPRDAPNKTIGTQQGFPWPGKRLQSSQSVLPHSMCANY